MRTYETLLADAERLPVPDRIQLFDAIWDTLPVDALPPLSMSGLGKSRDARPSTTQCAVRRVPWGSRSRPAARDDWEP